jgi:tetratricopeptide (TPR) repeat protein
MSRRPDPLDELGLDFEVALSREHARAHPDDLDALRALAYACTGAGRLTEALEVDRELCARAPDRADFRYDLACSYALLKRPDEAFVELEKALDLGFDDGPHLDEDPDLHGLRKDPRWAPLRRRLKP